MTFNLLGTFNQLFPFGNFNSRYFHASVFMSYFNTVVTIAGLGIVNSLNDVVVYDVFTSKFFLIIVVGFNI